MSSSISLLNRLNWFLCNKFLWKRFEVLNKLSNLKFLSFSETTGFPAIQPITSLAENFAPQSWKNLNGHSFFYFSTVKGGLISEFFSHSLQSSNKCAKSLSCAYPKMPRIDFGIFLRDCSKCEKLSDINLWFMSYSKYSNWRWILKLL